MEVMKIICIVILVIYIIETAIRTVIDIVKEHKQKQKQKQNHPCQNCEIIKRLDKAISMYEKYYDTTKNKHDHLSRYMHTSNELVLKVLKLVRDGGED